jgi:hypothetical protein
MKLNRAITVWLLILVVESINGTIRRLWLVPELGEHTAHQIGVTAASILILLIAWWMAPWLNARTLKVQLQIGTLWVTLMFIFEFGVGLAVGNSMSQMFAEYDLTKGGLMGVGFLVLWLAPAFGAWMTNTRPPPLTHKSNRK